MKNVRLSKKDEEAEQAVEDRAKHLWQADSAEMEDGQDALAGCIADNVQNAVHDVISAHALSVMQDKHSSTDLADTYSALNADQKRIVDKVVAVVCAGISPMRMVVSGQGGTGKSRVIDVVSRLVCSRVTSQTLPVGVAAPTGLAAFSIGGTTVHRIFCLPVEHGKPADYTRLSQTS